MPVALTYPGVYIQEIPSGVRTITGVATSITAFVGRTLRGPVNQAVTINSFGDFERTFGGLWVDGPLSYAVRDFFLNGGGQAMIVRLFDPFYATAEKQQEDYKKQEAAAKSAFTNTVSAVNNVTNPTADSIITAITSVATGKEGVQAAVVAALLNIAKDAQSKNAAEMPDVIVKAIKDAINAAEGSVVSAAAATAAPVTKTILKVGTLKLEAISEGAWGNGLRARVDHDAFPLSDETLFNLTVRDTTTGATEVFRNLSIADGPRNIKRVLASDSRLVRTLEVGSSRPVASDAILQRIVVGQETNDDKGVADAILKPEGANQGLIDSRKAKATTELLKDPFQSQLRSTGVASYDTSGDGRALNALSYLGSESGKTGIYALEQADLFNLLCIPPDQADQDIASNVISAAAEYCQKRRAILIIDPLLKWTDTATVADDKTGRSQIGTSSKNAAIFFPRLLQPNPLRGNQIETFAPCGAVAGIIARTDAQRGLWKAPAGLDATLVGVQQLSVPLTDAENGQLNPLGINCLRALPAVGPLIWGARTLEGDDRLASEWKYLPIRRLALYIEESLYRGTQWVVFEPNDEPLWSQIRLNLGAFMHNLFRQGAFQGRTPREAYFVKCDSETTTQNDINLGIVNIVVGFAPLKPAEFVVISLQQIAGQIAV